MPRRRKEFSLSLFGVPFTGLKLCWRENGMCRIIFETKFGLRVPMCLNIGQFVSPQFSQHLRSYSYRYLLLVIYFCLWPQNLKRFSILHFKFENFLFTNIGILDSFLLLSPNQKRGKFNFNFIRL